MTYISVLLSQGNTDVMSMSFPLMTREPTDGFSWNLALWCHRIITVQLNNTILRIHQHGDHANSWRGSETVEKKSILLMDQKVHHSRNKSRRSSNSTYIPIAYLC